MTEARGALRIAPTAVEIAGKVPAGCAVGIIPTMRIYNTLSRSLEDFVPREPGKVSMYVCGATVQTRPHLGHGRYAVVFDMVCSYFEWLGYDVTYVRNITDVDDKIIAAAEQHGTSTEEIVEASLEAFRTAYDELRLRVPDVEPRATEHIREMIEMIERLTDTGHAYESGGDVYFSVRGFEGYGKLSGRNIDELLSGARVDLGETKRDPLDFVLWKAAKPGEPTWDSPWGSGRPGWHIECSAMARKYLGFSFDIHGGGNDLLFPHHENEIAQAEAAHGDEPFVRFWMHNGMLMLDKEKMSKSAGHMIDLVDVVTTYPALALRLFYLRTHYRKPIEFTEAAMEDAVASLNRLWSFRRRASGSGGTSLDKLVIRFRKAMDEDFDVPGALSVLFETVRKGNRCLDNGLDARRWVATYDELGGILGLLEPVKLLEDIRQGVTDIARTMGVPVRDDLAATVNGLIELREEARNASDWATADLIRDALTKHGILLEDTADGARWHRS